MNTPTIILTQSYIDQEKLKYRVVDYFQENKAVGVQGSDDEKSQKIYNSCIASGKVMEAIFDSKKDIKELVSEYYRVYSDDSILFLGNISSYSVPLQEGLLKILEEPPEKLHIVMFAHDVESLLPTIKSRSRVIHLEQKNVFELMDAELKEKVAKSFPAPSEIIKKIITNQIKLEDFASINFPKITREEIDLWLYQMTVNAAMVYKQKHQKQFASPIQKLSNARQLNKQNVQKKFVVYSLLSEPLK